MYKIVNKKVLNPAVKLMDIEAPRVAKSAIPGQFVIIKVNERGERVPLTIADFDRERGTVTIVFQEVGKSTKLLGSMNVGDYIEDFAGPLGKGMDVGSGVKKVLGVGGGVGIPALYPKLKMLHNEGYRVEAILGGKSEEYIVFKDRMEKVCDKVYYATDDGSLGKKGFVTDVLKERLEVDKDIDVVITVGPMIMMKNVSLMTNEYNIHTLVSMNPLMVDGTGMCGACRIVVGGETKFVCIDGPVFDGHKVDFDIAMKRLNMYKSKEKQAEFRRTHGGGCCAD
ncbi:sulfide/dihydroorotate dehydrogenase-like FAD/NAD-binding protein [Thermoanaerobacterium sp. RBIITD]|uniref:sulfide/dihydroorotate dehydrogenase-like FAD/NAD-binding protein n=1 Tax=Thermoanaerobacterium sp. RBIITD TaxID=1550240 RepID=UPI000BB98165|nr:sulfide/dihydroorotate dehydrogenase-like FAD/NAD-binding protein [Thermoanaerobacterium sp. RBIITD]SNX53077.1 ferredoxin--NADP+ reductase [Thermoanaerobacterium sp. RBIITD]